jgi:sialic acid synthase SpsE
MKIGDFDTDARVLVIAEIGNNHEGDVNVARELVQRAAEAGADAVKFQSFRTELFVSPTDTERFARMRSFELTAADFASLAALARSLDLLFATTPLDLESVTALEPAVDAFKVASGDNTFYPLLDKLAKTGKPLIVSGGLADADELERIVAFVMSAGSVSELAVLHCVSSYPAPDEEANLAAVTSLAHRLRCTVGYSDHTLGIDAAVLSVAAGARIVEKHFTLDVNYSEFRDHQLSADPVAFAELVERVRAVEDRLGTGEKIPQPSELDGLTAFRRSIAAARDLPAGHEVQLEDLVWLRPGDGIPPGDEATVVGRRLIRPFAAGQQFQHDDVE